jgi:hypothetical protein
MKNIICTFIGLLIFISSENTTGQTQEAQMCLEAFGYASTISTTTVEAIATAAEAVWGASDFNGGFLTTTGTLTQTSINPETWTYSSSPANKLVVAYFGGPTIEFVFTTFQGWLNGTWEDFTNSHLLDFTVYISGQLNLRIQSDTYPTLNADTIKWQRTITGTALYYGITMNTNINHSGSKYYDIGSGYAFYRYWEQYSGSANSSFASITVSEASFIYIAHDSNLGQHVRNQQFQNNSSASFGGNTYQYQNAYASWAAGSLLDDPGAFNVVIDVNYWSTNGQMLKNGVQFGVVEFDGPVVAGFPGPNLILRLVATNEPVFIHTLISATGVNISNELPYKFNLAQNFPNPFNPSTIIRYQVPEEQRIIIKIYDALGKEIETLTDEIKHPGYYEVIWNGKNQASGIYFYRLISEGCTITKKMLLLR